MNTLVKRVNEAWSPFDEILGLAQGFENWFGTAPLKASNYGYPVVNIYGNEQELVFEASIPGVDPAKLDLSIDRDLLSLKGTREAVTVGKGEKVIVQGRNTGEFERSYRFPFEVNSDSAKAEYKHGVLRVNVKRAETSKAKSIDINVA